MESNNDWKVKFKKYFPKKNQWLIVLLTGILLVVIALPTSDGKSESEDTTDNMTETTENESSDYAAQMEKKLVKILRNVEGVGDVKVMITLKESSAKVVEKDVAKSSRTEEDLVVESESSEATVYSEGSSSVQNPYVSKEISPAVEGVLVIAEGGDNSVVVQNITEAIQALFNVEMHKIKVMKGN